MQTAILIIAFLIGCLYTRIYYARITKKTDWMNSWKWTKNPIWRKLHRLNCELCPKRHYCQTYKDTVVNHISQQEAHRLYTEYKQLADTELTNFGKTDMYYLYTYLANKYLHRI